MGNCVGRCFGRDNSSIDGDWELVETPSESAHGTAGSHVEDPTHPSVESLTSSTEGPASSGSSSNSDDGNADDNAASGARGSFDGITMTRGNSDSVGNWNAICGGADAENFEGVTIGRGGAESRDREGDQIFPGGAVMHAPADNEAGSGGVGRSRPFSMQSLASDPASSPGDPRR